MRAEHLLQWLISAIRYDSPDAINWQKVVFIIQAYFRDGTLAKDSTWYTVILIPKGKRELRGIGLVKIIWKAVASLLNHRLTSAITFHNMLHWF